MWERQRALLVSERPLVASGLAAWLQDEFEIVGPAADPAAVLRFASAARPEDALVDLATAPLSGLDLVRCLRQARIGIVAISACDDTDALPAACAARVRTYLLDDADRASLLAALRTAATGAR